MLLHPRQRRVMQNRDMCLFAHDMSLTGRENKEFISYRMRARREYIAFAVADISRCVSNISQTADRLRGNLQFAMHKPRTAIGRVTTGCRTKTEAI